jgi:hypothetical protein
MGRYLTICCALMVLACGTKKSEKIASDEKAAAASETKSPIGGVESVEVSATGIGATREDAIRDAAIRAIEEVHGRAIAISTVSADLGSIAVKSARASGNASESSEASVTATAGGRQLLDATGGIITSLKVEQENEQSGRWHVVVRANVARYSPPGSKTRIVVASTTDANREATPALLASIRNGIADALTATGRAAVLDRESTDLDAELAFAASGKATPTETLKQAQADVADFVVVTRLDNLHIDRHARPMRTAEREIVSYAGRGSLTFRVIHLASRQVLASGTIETSKSSEESLREEVDTNAWKSEMLRELRSRASDRIVSALLPIRVVSQDGAEVTVNAGTGRIQEGVQYAVVILGDEITDPESKESIGRKERACCQLSITSVSEHIAVGRLSEPPTLKAGEVLEVRPLSPTP